MFPPRTATPTGSASECTIPGWKVSSMHACIYFIISPLIIKNVYNVDVVVTVYGVEYAFGAHESSWSGIFEGEPKKCEGFKFRKRVMIGKTGMGESEVKAVMEELGGEYRGNAYNLISKNCNHFSNAASRRLTGKSIPAWVNRLAKFGMHVISSLLLVN
ncbi:deSI-like protein At4g17486 [Arachis ipaensis]|uniref:deSI-like protein At4g17486 n=1 Tax=Arachis ipaensis TaxID=130454 RepID=UPI000A2B925A|nr:deSI-like protein At4g17486 [Arachis ipaensis]